MQLFVFQFVSIPQRHSNVRKPIEKVSGRFKGFVIGGRRHLIFMALGAPRLAVEVNATKIHDTFSRRASQSHKG